MLSGRITFGKGQAPHPVQLYSYELTGHGHRRERRACQGGDRHDPHRRPQVLDVLRADGRQRQVHLVPRRGRPGGRQPRADGRCGVGRRERLHGAGRSTRSTSPRSPSSTLNIQLPSTPGATLVKSSLNPQAVPGALYRGLLVGVVGGKGGVIKPLSATWPDANGRFELVLPSSARGARRQVLGERAAVLLHLRRQARRHGRLERLPEVARL